MNAWWRLIKFGFRLLYNEMAWTYDWVSRVVSLGDWRRWQRSALQFLDVPPGTCVLELAHGTGNLQIDLRTAGLTSIGYDLSAQMGRIARRKLLRHRIEPRLVRGRAEQLPFADESFPAVVSTFPTAFIIEPETLSEVHRILAPDGRLVVVYNGLLARGGLPGKLLEWLYQITGQRGPWPDGIVTRFEEAGFTLRRATVPFERSEALLMIAEKQPISP